MKREPYEKFLNAASVSVKQQRSESSPPGQPHTKKHPVSLQDTMSSYRAVPRSKASATYLASENQRQRVVRAGNFAMAQQRSALRAFHYRRHSWIKTSCLKHSEGEAKKTLCSHTRLNSQRKGQRHTRERLRTCALHHTCTISTPPLCSLSTIPHIYITPAHPLHRETTVALVSLVSVVQLFTDGIKQNKKEKSQRRSGGKTAFSLQYTEALGKMLTRAYRHRSRTTAASCLLKLNSAEPNHISPQCNHTRFYPQLFGSRLLLAGSTFELSRTDTSHTARGVAVTQNTLLLVLK